MELATPQVHRTLAYLVALSDQNHRPTVDNLDEYASRPSPRPQIRQSPITRLAAQINRYMFDPDEGESVTTFMLRLGWITVDDETLVAPTSLGRATFRALEVQSVQSETPMTIVLDEDDPMALALVIQRIAGCGPSLLVDPYFRLEQLMPVAMGTRVDRVLTTDRTSKTDRDVLKLGVESLHLDRDFEVRVAGREVHDRYLVPDDGNVQFIGASLNGLGAVTTAMGPVTDAADALRARYNELWQSSEVLAVARVATTEDPT